MLDGIWFDLRFALRGLRRYPAFAFGAILATGLSIGACAAVFSSVDRILFRPLPYANEDRLVSVGMLTPLDRNEFLFAEPYFQMRRDPGPFEDVTSFQAGAMAVDWTGGRTAVRLRALRVETNFLPLFGMRSSMGRGHFLKEEDTPNGPPVAMISHALWTQRFGSDAKAIGTKMTLDGVPTEIVGVLPADFLMPTLTPADILLPLALNEATERSGRALRVFGRLRSGVSLAQAVEQMQPAFQKSLETVPPRFRKEISLRMRSVLERQTGESRRASILLLAAVAAVLLIAITHVAGLLLARTLARGRELSIRAALGATKAQLLRMSLVESTLLSAIGGGGGAVVAWILLRAFSQGSALPRLQEASLDGRTVGLLIAISFASGIIAGWLAFAGPVSHRITQGTLAVAGIAMSMVLLGGAALLLRSLWNLRQAPLGFESAHVAVAEFTLGKQKYSSAERQIAFFEELRQRLSGAPGIERFAISDSIPPHGGMRGRPFSTIDVEGRAPIPQGTGGMVSWRFVSAGYFQTMSIPIVRGRGFAEGDPLLRNSRKTESASSIPGLLADRIADPFALPVVLSEALARKLFPNGEDPLGKRILKRPGGEWSTVVGVARDVVNLGARRESWPEFYVLRGTTLDHNYRNQEPPTGWRAGFLLARTGAAPSLAMETMREAIQTIDPDVPVEVRTMEDRVESADEGPRFFAWLLTAFGVMGLVIASAGVFGTISFLVNRRTREIGVRMALGASPARILLWSLRPAFVWVSLGVALGLAGCAALSRLLGSLLFQVGALEAGPLAGAAGLLAVVSILAALAPAWRGAAVDPSVSLRQE